MPTFLLSIKADFENISQLDIHANGRFCIDVRQQLQGQQVHAPVPNSSSCCCTGCVCCSLHATAAAALHLPPCAWPQVKESAGAETRERVYVSATDEHELSGSRGSANFVMKFAKDARHECSINVMALKGVTRPATGAACSRGWQQRRGEGGARVGARARSAACVQQQRWWQQLQRCAVGVSCFSSPCAGAAGDGTAALRCVALQRTMMASLCQSLPLSAAALSPRASIQR